MSICVSLVHSPLHDEAFIKNVEDKIKSAVSFEKYTGRIYDDTISIKNECEGYIFVLGTGGTEKIALNLTKKIKHKPLILLSYDVANSLPALMEAYPLIKSENSSSTYILAKFDELEEYLRKSINIMETVIRIKKARLGLIGGISEWLIYSKTSPEDVKNKLGASLIDIPIEKVYELYDSVSDEEVDRELKEILKQSIPTVSIEEVKKAVKFYKAIEKIIKAYELDGYSIKCFDVIKNLRTTACIATSLFNSRLIPSGCEGDIPSFLSMIIMMYLTKRPAFMGNPSVLEGNKMMIAHCTAAWSLSAEKPILKTHFESGIGVGIAITFRKGIVTFLRLSPELNEARVFKGTVVSGEPSSPRHCRSQAWVELEFSANKLLDKSLGNHYVFIEGDYVNDVKALLELFNIKVENF